MESTSAANMSKLILCHVPENQDWGISEGNESPATALQLSEEVRETLLAMPTVREAYDSAKEREAINPTEEKILVEVPLSNAYVRQKKGPRSVADHEVTKVQFRMDLEENSEVLVFWKMVDPPAKTGGRGRKRKNTTPRRVVIENGSETDEAAKRSRKFEMFTAVNFENVVTERADFNGIATNLTSTVSTILKNTILLDDTARKLEEVIGKQKKLEEGHATVLGGIADYEEAYNNIEKTAHQLRLDLEHCKEKNEENAKRSAQLEEQNKMLVSKVEKLQELVEKNQETQKAAFVAFMNTMFPGASH